MKKSALFITLCSLGLAACGGGGGRAVPAAHVAGASAIRLPFTTIRATTTPGRFNLIDDRGTVVGTTTSDHTSATFQLNGGVAQIYTYDRLRPGTGSVISYTKFGAAVKLERSAQGIVYSFFDRSPRSTRTLMVPYRRTLAQATSRRRVLCLGEAMDNYLASLADWALQDLVTLTGIGLTTADNPNAVSETFQTNLGPVTYYVDGTAADLMLGDIANNNPAVWGEITNDVAQFMGDGGLVADDLASGCTAGD